MTVKTPIVRTHSFCDCENTHFMNSFFLWLWKQQIYDHIVFVNVVTPSLWTHSACDCEKTQFMSAFNLWLWTHPVYEHIQPVTVERKKS